MSQDCKLICEPIKQRDGHPDLHFRNGGPDGPDAKLMVAAPELLEALQLLLDDYIQISAMYQTNPDNGEWYEPQLVWVARAAITKATD